MREIKFRAWFDGEMGKPFELKYLMNRLARDPRLGGRDFNEYTMMQYTGLKDKNGKEIYEGDIINSCGNITVVKWGRNFTSSYGHGDSSHTVYTGFNWGGYGQDEQVRVIGNIHENPELLK